MASLPFKPFHPLFSPIPPLPCLRTKTLVLLLPSLNSHSPLQSPSDSNPAERWPESNEKKTRRRKLRPDFYEQTIQRWSAKIYSPRTRFPWQERQEDGKDGTGTHTDLSTAEDIDFRFSLMDEKVNASLDGERFGECSDGVVSQSSEITSPERVDAKPLVDERSSLPSGRRRVLAPWDHGVKPKKPQLGSISERRMAPSDPIVVGELDEDEKHEGTLEQKTFDVISRLSSVSLDEKTLEAKTTSFCSGNYVDEHIKNHSDPELKDPLSRSKLNGKKEISRVSLIVDELKSSFNQHSSDLNRNKKQTNSDSDTVKLMGSVSFPWERGSDGADGQQLHRRSNTEHAERTIPELELQRIRNVALRMKERMKVGAAGVTEAVVKSIHDKWKVDEVIKLKFEGPPTLNMKRTHEILEKKTGGLVIWRSGSSIVLYRGMTYRIPCVQSYSRLANVVADQESIPSSDTSTSIYNISGGRRTDVVRASSTSAVDNMTSFPRLSEGSLVSNADDMNACPNSWKWSVDILEIDSLLNQLGPRFKDWSGRNPLPVDADLLPGVVPGYKSPYRLLPHKTRRSLRDRDVTFFRRLARGMPPHFALGRNRQHQGLANAMVKLWEKSCIAKIAIKRGVPNTCNDRMAEELKKLTGGVLLSRNKDFIVFYRGNDFLPLSIRNSLIERQKLANVQQDEEEEARLRASALIAANAKTVKGPLVAGTLQEFVKANTRWANQPSIEDREKTRKELVLAKHAGAVRFLERKLFFAQLKVKKAEKALAKVQEFLKPAELPTDIETITDEERFLFRQMGLKMRAFLLVGRREVFDGVVQNIHLHWKHRELVKIIVRGKRFPQVKHMAISLEAESGGLLISLDKTTKGYAIILYRGKNYQRPHMLKPRNLLTKRQALARAIELQRREALNHHILDLREKIHSMRLQLYQMEYAKELGNEMDLRVDESAFPSDNVEDEGEEAFLETYNSGGEEDDSSPEMC
ncbi:hypothetical protein J5N97_003845 [Dioscorea zingiberensis]|uniref:CRM domain-containing protein n=1 Tax=Dioscorea zingiberensis TaxID=325984 RepID=A0A9D5HQU1_9LILI|nr:hypothetical protein J5N97_003845 [Dioscorea zingiberensis]